MGKVTISFLGRQPKITWKPSNTTWRFRILLVSPKWRTDRFVWREIVDSDGTEQGVNKTEMSRDDERFYEVWVCGRDLLVLARKNAVVTRRV